MPEKLRWFGLALFLVCGILLFVYLFLPVFREAPLLRRSAGATSNKSTVQPIAESAGVAVRPTEMSGSFAAAGSSPDSSRRAGVVAGKVTSIRGGPVPGALVSLYEFQKPTGEFDGVIAQTLTDGSGAYSLALFTPTKGVLSVRADGYVQSEQPVESDGVGVLERDFILSPATASLSGTVRDPSGNPIAGALVAVSFPQVSLGDRSFIVPMMVKTDASGFFEFETLAAQPVSVMASAHGFLSQGRTVKLSEGEGATADFVLQKGRTISVPVISTSGEALPSSSASCAGLMFPFPADEGGVVEILLADQPSRNLTCSFGAAGFESRVIEVDTGNPPKRVSLAPAAVYEGLVVSDLGEGVSHARVFIWCGDHRRDRSSSAETDEMGRFELRPPSSKVWELSIEARGYLRSRYAGAAPIPTGSTFTLSRSDANLQGRVVWSDGTPLKGFIVLVWAQDTGNPDAGRTAPEASPILTATQTSGRQDGTFFLPKLRSGPHRLRIMRVSDVNGVLTYEQTLTIHEGLNDLSIRLDREGRE